MARRDYSVELLYRRTKTGAETRERFCPERAEGHSTGIALIGSRRGELWPTRISLRDAVEIVDLASGECTQDQPRILAIWCAHLGIDASSVQQQFDDAREQASERRRAARATRTEQERQDATLVEAVQVELLYRGSKDPAPRPRPITLVALRPGPHSLMLVGRCLETGRPKAYRLDRCATLTPEGGDAIPGPAIEEWLRTQIREP